MQGRSIGIIFQTAAEYEWVACGEFADLKRLLAVDIASMKKIMILCFIEFAFLMENVFFRKELTIVAVPDAIMIKNLVVLQSVYFFDIFLIF